MSIKAFTFQASHQRHKKLGITDIGRCVLCNNSQESSQHLFFQCSFSAYLWSLCRLKLGLKGDGIDSLQEAAALILVKLSTKTKTAILAKLAFQATVWHIWKEQNLRVFQAQEQHKVVALRRLHDDIRLLLWTCNW